MKHTLKEIVKSDIAQLSYICEGKAYYNIEVDDSKYQLELDTMDDDWKATHLHPQMKTLHLMRWIRKGIENGKLIQLI
jgi:hypothetical protein